MTRVELTITGRDRLESAVRRAVRASERASEAEVDHLLRLHRESVLSGRAPGGGSQRALDLDTVERKRSALPLYDTGTLANTALWRRLRTPRGLRLLPPVTRVKALRHLRRRGFRTIFDLPTRLEAARIMDQWRREWRMGGGR